MKTLKLLAILLSISAISFANKDKSAVYKEGYATISGYIKDETGEELIGANVFVKGNTMGTVTNIYGFYSLTLPKGEYTLTYSFIGYEVIYQLVVLTSNKTLNINLLPGAKSIKEVSISAARKDVNVSDVSMSTVKLQSKQIKKIPVLFGEQDVLKTIQLLPGVQTVGEGTSGFYVRGGSVDQNLIVLDDATVYNPSHLGGIFSVFNGDAIKNVELYKGGIPSAYGGRLASVLDVRMKDGNMSQASGNGGIGLISSRLLLEGPILKNKSSYLLSARRTYADIFFPFSNNDGLKASRLYFYDVNGKVNFIINDNNRVFVSVYTGRDVAKLDTAFKISYGNITISTRWNHVFNNKVFSNTTLTYSDFNYSLGQPEGPNAFDWSAGIVDKSIKHDYIFYLNPNNTVKLGFQSTFHTIKPGRVEVSDDSFFNLEELEQKNGLESAVFIENQQKLGEKWLLRYGLRLSNLYNIGEEKVYKFNENDKGLLYVSDSTMHKKGKFFNPNYGLEPRFSLRYLINNSTSIKASYDRTYQYMHLATNTASTTPLDLWFLSNPNIKPQDQHQYAAGLFKNFKDNTFETSVEFYYKDMNNAIDFRDHAQLFLNKHFDGELRRGDAYSYGAEVFIRKQQGQFTGWISYTYARTKRKINGVNNNEEYNAPYDKPHDLKIVAIYEAYRWLTLASNWVYSSPMPLTMAVEWYKHENLWVPKYSKRNEVRLKGTEYHRLDFSATFHFKKKKQYEHSLQLSVYNVYNRHNVYTILYQQPNGTETPPVMKKMYLFKTLPTVTYNFKF